LREWLLKPASDACAFDKQEIRVAASSRAAIQCKRCWFSVRPGIPARYG
jgi:hypothetical protein